MDLFDILDREGERLAADFKACLPMPGDAIAWSATAQAVLGRLATYTLAIDQVLQPTLLTLQFDELAAFSRTHERLHRVVAEALLGMRGPLPQAEKALRATRHMLQRYRLRLRRDFYPALYRLLSATEAAMLADDLLQWMDRHCRQLPEPTPLRRVRRAGENARPPRDARLPTLHHVVTRPADAARPSWA